MRHTRISQSYSLARFIHLIGTTTANHLRMYIFIKDSSKRRQSIRSRPSPPSSVPLQPWFWQSTLFSASSWVDSKTWESMRSYQRSFTGSTQQVTTTRVTVSLLKEPQAQILLFSHLRTRAKAHIATTKASDWALCPQRMSKLRQKKLSKARSKELATLISNLLPTLVTSL